MVGELELPDRMSELRRLFAGDRGFRQTEPHYFETADFTSSLTARGAYA